MHYRLLDVLAASVGLILLSPVLVPAMLIVWLHDSHSPFYISPRVGEGGKTFRMVKLRSMVVNADENEVDSTSASDPRISPVGRIIRRFKLDELTQLWNVLIGNMSLVGPRPNVERETQLYTAEERRLLTVRPGITDYASIVFSDEGEILRGEADPDLAYNQLIRPWKSRLSLFYIDNRSLLLAVKLIYLTALSLLSRQRALQGVAVDLTKRDAPPDLVRVALRTDPLVPHPPPGADTIVISRRP